MHLFDTAKRKIVPFSPGPVVTLYTCGITPYDSTHIGHAAVYLTFDILQRRLRDLGHETRCVRNVTDIDDDILRTAKERDMYYLDLVASEVKKFDADMRALNVLKSWSDPHASSAIDEIIAFTQKALTKNYAYEVAGTVFFDVGSWPKFGEISNYNTDEMLKIAAERGGFPDDKRKRNPLDFILWQKSTEGEPSWPSPWGDGRPGWHIECSALAQRELGEVIDIHGGGADLIFPHHECEAAQSEAVNGKPFVRHWMHQAMVRMDGEKMSKSLGNMEFVGELRKQHDPRAIRLAITNNHYRSEWEWHSNLLKDATQQLVLWQDAAKLEQDAAKLEQDAAKLEQEAPSPVLAEVRSALDNDLDTESAILAIDRAAAQGQGIVSAAALLGIDL